MADTPDRALQDVEDEIRDEIPSLVGEVLSGRYRIEAELGTGGMGAVYRAEHTLMRKRLAVKVLHPEMTQLPEVVERFEREAMAAAHIEHPNVAAATDFGKLDNGSFFLVLEYVEGESLRDALEHGPLSPRRAIHVGRQIVAALVRAHSLGIVHRDLKPENVMLVERDGDPDFVKVLDFGIAKVPVAEISKEAGKKHKTLTKVGMVYGTPEYMAPEQALGQDVDARADLYALGVIMYEMLMGRRPFESDSPVTLLGMQVTAQPPPFAQIAPNSDISGEIEAVVMELLEKEASKRPSDAKQVRDAFDYLAQFVGDNAAIPLEQSGMIARAATGIAPVSSEALPTSHVIVKPVPSQGIRERISDGLDRVQSSVSPSRIERVRQELARLIPGPVASVPLLAWVGGAGAVVLLLVAIAGVAIAVSRTPDEAKPAFGANWPPAVMSVAVEEVSAKAEPAEVTAAVKAGKEALEKLYEKYPNDPAVLEPVAKARLGSVAPIAAVEVYERLFSLAPKKIRDDRVVSTLVAAAGKQQSQDAAFEVFTNHMGTEGPDLIYDLAFEKVPGASKSATARAADVVKTDAVRKRASPAMLVALDLRFAGGCQSKHALLDRAKEHGDERTSVQLRGLFRAKGCGFLGLADCWKCMRNDRKLPEAVKAIDERAKAKPPKPATSK